MKDILTTKVLEDLLLAYQARGAAYTDVTVSFADEQEVKHIVPTFLGFAVVHVWIDPTLKQGECYWGRPDPERLGERFRGYLVSEKYKETSV